MRAGGSSMFIYSIPTSSSPALGYVVGTLQNPCLSPGLWASAPGGAGRCGTTSVCRLGRVAKVGGGDFPVPWPSMIMIMTRNNTHGHPSPRTPPGPAQVKSFTCTPSSKSHGNSRSKCYCIAPFVRGDGGIRSSGIGDCQTVGLGGR